MVTRAALVFFRHSHSGPSSQAGARVRRVDLSLHASFEPLPVMLNRVQRRGDVAAFNHFLDIVATGFLGIEKDVNLADVAKKVVQVAHDVVGGAHEKEARVVYGGGLSALYENDPEYFNPCYRVKNPTGLADCFSA